MNAADGEVRVVLDQVYSQAGGAARLADLYLPSAGEALLPVVIWLHGGGWRFGDRKLAPDLALFARRSELAVASIDYRLSDEANFPAPVEDVKTAVRWVRSVAGEFGLDPARIALWGSSAGAHLAACAALSSEQLFASEEHDGYSSTVQAIVDGYGPIDFARIDADRAAMQSAPTDAESALVGKLLAAGHPDSFESRLLGRPVSTSPEQVKAANPIHFVHEADIPFLILHGEADTLIPWQQSRLLFDALDSVGEDATLVLFEKLSHGFFNNPQLAEEDYGSVTVHRTLTRRSSRARWTSNQQEGIPAMVESFLRAHLSSR
jgi:acetyl esterase/lipase